MEKLRLEETVYTMEPNTINKQRHLNTNETIKNKEQTSTPADIQYMEGRNSELICQIGKRTSYLLCHGCRNERIHMDSQGYVTMTALLEWLNNDLHHHLDSEGITWIVENKDKVLFSIDPTRGVKFNYGHSLELLEMDMKE